MFVCMYVCMYVCLYVCIYLCMRVLCMYVSVRMYVCMHVCMYLYVYICLYIFAHSKRTGGGGVGAKFSQFCLMLF